MYPCRLEAELSMLGILEKCGPAIGSGLNLKHCLRQQALAPVARRDQADNSLALLLHRPNLFGGFCSPTIGSAMRTLARATSRRAEPVVRPRSPRNHGARTRQQT